MTSSNGSHLNHRRSAKSAAAAALVVTKAILQVPKQLVAAMEEQVAKVEEENADLEKCILASFPPLILREICGGQHDRLSL